MPEKSIGGPVGTAPPHSSAHDGWTNKSDDQLLRVILESGLRPEEKAQAVLSMRERRVTEIHNRRIRLLSVLVAIATAIQGIGAGFSIYIALRQQPAINLITPDSSILCAPPSPKRLHP